MNVMRDLKSSRAIWFKGIAFLLIAIVSCVLIVLETPTLQNIALLLLAIWASCRAYYFAFYVIQHYVDPEFRFSGLGSFVMYALRRRSNASKD